ncbi:TonB family protein [Actimicrobium antarcticum]|uniref:Protein TonB n=1 Tax=Actimicrobium antarcticum TaxID=1051899 RepID=A0ABP7T2Y9_9BURK
MKTRLAVLLAALSAALAACTSSRPGSTPRSDTLGQPAVPATSSAPTSPGARTLGMYKEEIAQRISDANASQVYPGQPQAFLRSVIVVKFELDAAGKLLRSEILRSNHDKATESTALASLRASAPFPRPPAHLLRHGKLDISETWLFNGDGRFQIRSIAQPQMSE